jgi:MFS family permease
MGLAEGVPAITGSFISGHVVDTNRPALVYQLSITVSFLNACLLLAAIIPAFGFSVDLRVTLLFTGMFISGASRSFTAPSVFSLIPQIVPRNMIGSAAAWNSSAYQFAAILGPALGGLVYGIAGPIAAFSLPPLLMLIAWLSAWLLTPAARAMRSQFKREPFFQSVQSGIQFAFRQKVLLSTMTLDMFSVLFGGAVAMLPIFADEVFKVGSIGLGFLRTAPSVGSVIVAFFLATRPMKIISGKTLLLVVAGFGLSIVVFALSKNFYLALFMLAISGAFDGVSMVIRSTILQLLTPEQMRGRVSSLSSVFIASSNEIGAFESGVAARFMGLIPSVVFGGIMTLLVVGFTAWWAPDLARTRIDQDEPAR